MKNFQKNKLLTVEKHIQGFSLPELLVGVVIALISSVAIFQVFSTYQAQKQSTTAESDALQSGNLAAFLLSSELRKAGTGINTNRIYPRNALPGTITPLYGCQMTITPAEHNKPIETGDVPDTDNNGAKMNGTFNGYRIFRNNKIPLVPLLIKENTNNSGISVNNVSQDILISMASTTSVPGVAPICNVKSITSNRGNSARQKAEYEEAEDNCNYAGKTGSLITLGYKTSEPIPQQNGLPKYETKLNPLPNRGKFSAPIGFCSTMGLRWDQGGYNWGSMCYETILTVNPNFTQCTLTTTGAYTQTGNFAHGWQAQLAPNGKKAGTMQVPLLSLQNQISGDIYGGGYVMSLGRLDYKNVREEQDDFVQNGEHVSRKENLRRSGFALFTVGKDGQEQRADRNLLNVTNHNLLRYDIIQNRLEVLADNIVLIKAIYGLAGENDADGSSRRPLLRNIHNINANQQNWMNPNTNGWRFTDLTATDAAGNLTDVARNRLRRIRAVKVAIVARNPFPEEDNILTSFKLFEKELGNNAIEVRLDDDAKKYRYEIFEFVVPLQSAQYGFDQAYASCVEAGGAAQCKQ